MMRFLILSSSSSGGHGCLIRSTPLLPQLPINLTVYHLVIKSGFSLDRSIMNFIEACDSSDIQIRKLIHRIANINRVFKLQSLKVVLSLAGESSSNVDPEKLSHRLIGHPAEMFYNNVREVVMEAKECYVELLDGLTDEEFANMMFFDGGFIDYPDNIVNELLGRNAK